MKMNKVIIACMCAILLLPGLSFAKKNQIPVKKLKKINTIAPIMVQFNRSMNASKSGLSMLSNFKTPDMSQEEITFYNQLAEKTLTNFKAKTKKTLQPITSTPNSAAYNALLVSEVKKKYYLPSPYQQLKYKKKMAELGEIAKNLNVDAVAIFDFGYGVYSTGVGPLTKKSYRIKTRIIVVDTKGNVLINTKIKPKHIKGKMGLSISDGFLNLNSKTQGYYNKLAKSWTKTYLSSFK